MRAVVAPSSRRSCLAQYFAVIVSFFGGSIFFFNGQMLQLQRLYYQGGGDVSNYHSTAMTNHLEWFLKGPDKEEAALERDHEIDDDDDPKTPQQQQVQRLGTLSCAAYGGPSDQEAAEMIYWKDIPGDALHKSPFHHTARLGEQQQAVPEQYVTFEPDVGGFNNIRMSFETVTALAFAMGRTLVLPPEDKMYLLNHGKSKNHRREFSFAHFYNLEAIHEEHVGVNIITMQEFLERNIVKDPLSGKTIPPPHNRTNWNGHPQPIVKWLRKNARNVIWDTDECIAVFPASTSEKDTEALQLLNQSILSLTSKGRRIRWEDYVGHPVPVDAPPLDRLKELWADRKRLCVYDTELQQAPVLHFPADESGQGARLLVHFYAFLFHQNWNHDLWLKRFVRDHLYYRDEIQCAAARVVTALRRIAKQRGVFPPLPTLSATALAGMNQSSQLVPYDAFHIRRGDFQYSNTRISANEILQRAKRLIPANATVYIATDEKDKEFFKPLTQYFHVLFLSDFQHLLEDVNVNYFGMIDQLITSRSRIFLGCWFSTFTVSKQTF